MIQYGVVARSGKDVAIIAHQPNVGRVVFKGDTDSALYKAFAIARDKPVVIHYTEQGVNLRRKIVPKEEEYLRVLLDRVVHSPYEVRTIQPADTTLRLDAFADAMAKDLL